MGVNIEVVDFCFSGTVSRIEGIGFDGIAKEVISRHQVAYSNNLRPNENLVTGGLFQWKKDGELHLFNPQTIHLLQQASRKNDQKSYDAYAKLINQQLTQACTLRGLLTFRNATSIPIKEVEPVEKILKRFATGAMSFGSISHEAHSTLACLLYTSDGADE